MREQNRRREPLPTFGRGQNWAEHWAQRMTRTFNGFPRRPTPRSCSASRTCAANGLAVASRARFALSRSRDRVSAWPAGVLIRATALPRICRGFLWR